MYRNHNVQVPRTSASAAAFAQGLFPEDLDPHCTLPTPVAITMSPADDDPLLRFFASCSKYQVYKDDVERRLVRLSPWLWVQQNVK